MKRLKLLLLTLLFCSATFAARNPYYQNDISTTTGKNYLSLSGVISVAASTTTATTPTVIIDGSSGIQSTKQITVSSATVTGALSAGSVSAAGISSSAGLSGSTLAINTNKLYLGSNGNVGISSTTPSFLFTVNAVGTSATNTSLTGAWLVGIDNPVTYGLALRKQEGTGISGLAYVNQVFGYGGNGLEIYPTSGPTVIGYSGVERFRTTSTGAKVSGTTLEVNGVSYTFPASGGSANSVLTENGSHTLSWTSVGSASNPTGTVITFVSSTCPSGYLAVNGASISTTTYSTLCGVIGNTAGNGFVCDPASATFTLPDMRGYFVRGYDASAGVDSGRVFGTTQTDALQGHVHHTAEFTGGTSINTTGTGTSVTGRLIDTPGSATQPTLLTGTPVSDGTNGTPRIATETRPKNIALQYCIRY